jgi:serine/threonine-protein kinase
MVGLDSISDTYEIIEKIGSGGGGTVYKAYHRRLQKDVVIKKMHEEVKDIINSRAETDILKNLRHSYLPQVLDFLEIDGNIYTVMDYIPGKSFQQLLDEGKKFTQRQVIKWARQMAEALEYLHNQTPPIIHSDIKPANIMLTPKDDICLIDFNISSVFEKKGTQPVGFSDGYSPPEQYPVSKRRNRTAIISIGDSNIKSKRRNNQKYLDNQKEIHDFKQKVEGLSSNILSSQLTEVCIKNNIQEPTEFIKRIQNENQTEYLSRNLQGDKEQTEYFDRNIQDNTDRTELFDVKSVDENTEYFNRETRSHTVYYDHEQKDIETEYFNRIDHGNYEQTTYLPVTNGKVDDKANDKEDDEEVHNASNQHNILAKAKVDERSDIYSLGATLYHLLTGVKPNSSLQGVASLTAYNIKVSDGLNYVIMKAMQPRPDKRFENASKLLKSLTQLNKLDKRYKRFILQQEIMVIIMLLLFSAAVLSIYYGKETMKQEKTDRYDGIINKIIQFREEADYNAFEDKYIEAVAMFPNNVNAYFQRALSLYEQGAYEEGIEYIQEQIVNKYMTYENDEVKADIYFILANCYFELEEYQDAVSNYQSAINYYSYNNEYYRDYAIALARLNETVKAGEILEEAFALGLTEDNIYLVKGEIDLSNGSYLSSVDNFLSCIKVTESDYSKNRAYVMCSKTFEEAGEIIEASKLKNIELLEEAIIDLPLDMTMIVNARLAEAYVEYGTLMQDNAYYQKAINVFNAAVNMGWDNYNTHNNLSLLYRQLNNYEKAYQELELMLKEYGENYNTYKRLAYLEADVQGAKINENREYAKFKAYYDQAMLLYEDEKKNNKNDTEMEFLESMYQDLVEGKWLEE